MERREAFDYTGWFKATGYEIAEGVIRPVPGASLSEYDPTAPALAKSPQKPGDWQEAPHTHLARLDPQDERAVLVQGSLDCGGSPSFVEQWICVGASNFVRAAATSVIRFAHCLIAVALKRL